MSEVMELESGICLGFGGTNARYGICEQGDVVGFQSIATPSQPAEFFAWLAHQTMEAADSGAAWAVAGFPGPVTPDGEMIGPMENVSGMAKKQYNLIQELLDSDPAFGRLLQEGFTFIAVNDGELAAQAAANRIGEKVEKGRFDKVAALILGTGVGAGIVKRDVVAKDVFRADRSNPAELGHVLVGLSGDPQDTYENTVSGPALHRTYKKDPKDINELDHPAWSKVGRSAGVMATTLGLVLGAELVVPTGGVGAGASELYSPFLTEMLDVYGRHGNAAQQLLLPEVRLVPSAESQIFELFGAEGIIRDLLTPTA